MKQEWVDTEAGLDEVVDALSSAERYAIDTEFHRERTYYPQLALVQIAWGDRLVLIDPLAVDITPMAAVLNSDSLAVLHACSQDLEVMQLATGSSPRRIFDTQIAAGFIGMRSPSLASLHDQLLGLKLAKANRLTDWLRRPLEAAQRDYAASDVEHLLQIQDRLLDRLAALGRAGWAEHEFELARTKGTTVRAPEDAWERIKEARSLGGSARAAARELAAWRERTAQQRDIPVRHVMPDLAVVALAQRPPKEPSGVGRARGLERRQLSNKDAREVVKVLERAKDMPPPAAPTRNVRSGPDLRPAVTLITAWLSQFADDNDLDPAMLGARADIEDFVRGDDSKLSHGWRQDLVALPMRALLDGDAAVAFDGNGRVIVEKRSFEPIAGSDFTVA